MMGCPKRERDELSGKAMDEYCRSFTSRSLLDTAILNEMFVFTRDRETHFKIGASGSEIVSGPLSDAFHKRPAERAARERQI